MRMSPFLLRNPALLIFTSLHTLPLCLLRLTDGVRIRSLSLILETYCIPLYTTSNPHTTRIVIFLNTFLSDLLSLLLFITCLVLPHTASSATHPFRSCSSCISHSYYITFACFLFLLPVLGPRLQLKRKRSFVHRISTGRFLQFSASVFNTAILLTLYLENTGIQDTVLPIPPTFY